MSAEIAETRKRTEKFDHRVHRHVVRDHESDLFVFLFDLEMHFSKGIYLEP